jgi:hypothetical protein
MGGVSFDTNKSAITSTVKLSNDQRKVSHFSSATTTIMSHQVLKTPRMSDNMYDLNSCESDQENDDRRTTFNATAEVQSQKDGCYKSGLDYPNIEKLIKVTINFSLIS